VRAENLAIAELVAVELQIRRRGDRGFEQGLAFDQRQQGETTPVEVHEVEGVVDDMDAAFAVAAALVRAKLGNPDSSIPHSSPSK
jgi:hypothetical protein